MYKKKYTIESVHTSHSESCIAYLLIYKRMINKKKTTNNVGLLSEQNSPILAVVSI